MCFCVSILYSNDVQQSMNKDFQFGIVHRYLVNGKEKIYWSWIVELMVFIRKQTKWKLPLNIQVCIYTTRQQIHIFRSFNMTKFGLNNWSFVTDRWGNKGEIETL